jgi:hypothetical protein
MGGIFPVPLQSRSQETRMTPTWKSLILRQFGAAIDMLENAITACPAPLWGDRIEAREFWYIAYHTIFFLDCYLSESGETYSPPPPFTRAELDVRGLLPETVYSKEQVLVFLAHGRAKAHVRIAAMSGEEAERRCGFAWLDMSNAELLLYNMRHVQHHAAQLNLLLSRAGHAAPRWVRAADITSPCVEEGS